MRASDTRKWSTWPSRDDFDAAKQRIDEGVLGLDRIHHQLAADRISPPITQTQVGDLSGFVALVDLDLRIMQGVLDELGTIRALWASWLVTPSERRDR